MRHTGLVPPSVPPYALTVEVCRRPISMKLDMEARVSVMAGKLFKRTFPGVAVETRRHAAKLLERAFPGPRPGTGQAEQHYSQLDKEGIARMFGIEVFSPVFVGRKFEAVTDHKPLLGLLRPDKAVPVQTSPRVVRGALKLAAYSYQFVYRLGKDVGPADALSR
ncbi:hypothetical protein MRX96_026338 [Rhipicephalus microplus]